MFESISMQEQCAFCGKSLTRSIEAFVHCPMCHVVIHAVCGDIADWRCPQCLAYLIFHPIQELQHQTGTRK